MALIPQFYAGKSIFITGATGFMGKVLVERLLETCPDIGNLYLLMRVKKNVAPEKRLQQIKQSPVFDVIRIKCPEQMDKLRLVPGDITQPGLGIPEESLQELKEVSVVFHSAATLKFHEELGVALQQNVRSVTRVLEIADNHMPKLQVFMHVSTAYSNPEREEVGECVYPAPATPEQLEGLVNALPASLLDDITLRYISPRPNTYTFTKAVAEGAVAKHGTERYPIVIFRPSIVISSLRSPMPGWIENLNGPSGLLVAAGKGFLHYMPGKSDIHPDLLPVDIGVDTMIAAAWQVAVDRPSEVKVYNCCTADNPITWGQMCDNYKEHTRRYPFDSSIMYPFGGMLDNMFLIAILEFLLQTVPTFLLEYSTRALGIKKRLNLITAAQKVHSMTEVLRFFTMHEYKFCTDNMKNLKNRLSDEDRNMYNLDVQSINWTDHNVDFVKGARKYLMNEKDEDIPKAKRHMQLLKVLFYATIIALTYFGSQLLLRILSVFTGVVRL